MEKLKAVLFDLDGVLVDACDWHFKALNKALLKTSQYEISYKDHLENYNGLPTLTKLNKLAELNLIDKLVIDKISILKQEYTLQMIRQYLEIDESKVNLMKFLKEENIKIACCTNSIRETAELMLGKIGILNMLDLLITNQDVLKPKPNPECFLKAISYFKVKPIECIIVEDSPKGFEAAIKTGCAVLSVNNATEVDKYIFEGVLCEGSYTNGWRRV